MNDIVGLSEDEKDFLREFMNIAYGNATAVVAEMLDAFASLSIPEIDIMRSSELLEKFKGLDDIPYYFSTQPFHGEFAGEIVFFLDDDSANNLATHLELEDASDMDDAVMELTNVLTSSLVSRLAQEMGSEVSFSVPKIAHLLLSNVGKNETFSRYDQIIVIQTDLVFEDQKIKGEIFILTKDESISWIKTSIQNLLDTLM